MNRRILNVAAALSVLAWSCTGNLWGQEASPSPAQVEALAKRFNDGHALLKQGKNAEALVIFQEIIAKEPKAKGSLLMAGFACLELDKPKEAAEHFQKLLELEPKDARAIAGAIQANQALQRDIKVTKLIEQLQQLKAANADLAGACDPDKFIREKVRRGGGTVVLISEYFDSKKEPYRVWTAEEMAPAGEIKRRLLLSYDEDATQEALALSKGKGGIEVYFLSEYVMDGEKLKEIRVYRQEFEKPKYAQAREWMVGAIEKPPTPLHTAVMDEAQAQPAAPAPGKSGS
jgi:tetratricopeptide (TPR) repeat protein